MSLLQQRYHYYTTRVFPQIPDEIYEGILNPYPGISLVQEQGLYALPETPVLMLVALTGTGKSTTLRQLAEVNGKNHLQYRSDLPSRRELADLIMIPYVQVMRGEPVRIVRDRVQRFAYTRQFAKEVHPGGLAVAFSWLFTQWDGHVPFVSEGIRGANEITFALKNCPNWRIAELWLNPLIRLQRLTNRNDQFDRTSVNLDLSFLPDELQEQVQLLIDDGEISPEAVSIAQAEALNYGIDPFDPANQTAGYQCIVIDDWSVDDVTARIIQMLKGTKA